jgi:hypothetical protein
MKKLTTLFLALTLVVAVNAQRLVLVEFTSGSKNLSELNIVKAVKTTDSTSVVTFVNERNDLQSGSTNTSTDSLLARSNKLFYLEDSVQVLNAAFINSAVVRDSTCTILYRERRGIVKYHDPRPITELVEVLRQRN